MTRQRALSLARNTGHTAWWVFVVATLFAGGITWTSVSTYGNYIGVTSFTQQTGWTAYTPMTDSSIDFVDFDSSSYDPWTELELLSAAAFFVVLVAAVVEALSARQMVPGIVTVAAPCVAFGMLLLATPGGVGTVEFDATVTVAVVLIAVAVREVWARRFAPNPSTLPPTATDAAR